MPLFGTLVLVECFSVDETSELNQLHEFRVRTSAFILAFILKRKKPAIIDYLHPEAVFRFASVSRVKFKLKLRGIGQNLKFFILSIEEEKHLGDGPIMR